MDEHVEQGISGGDGVPLHKLLVCYPPTSTSVTLAQDEYWMRWGFLIIMVVWMISGFIGSIALFLLTRSNLSFVPLSATVGVASAFLSIIVKFLFWRSEDYKLAELKQLLSVRRLELKCQIKKT